MNTSQEEEVFNPYKVLNLSEDASQKEVKNRFFSLSRAFHPDKQPTELFKESTQQFEKVEEAYKILSAPMRKYVFDKYGIEGIKVCNEKSGKLGSLEEEYKETALKYEDIQEKDDIDDIKKMEAEAELKLMKERVRENIEYLHRRLEEEHLSQTLAKEISVNQVIDLDEVVDYYIKNTAHAQQARIHGLKPQINYGGLFMNHWMLLPDYKGVQQLLGVYGNNNASKGEIQGLVTAGDNEKEVSLSLQKGFESGLHFSVNTKLFEGSVNATVNRMFADDMNWYTQGQYDGDGDLLTGVSKEFKNHGIKLDFGVQASSDKLRLTQMISKQISKKMVAFTSVNTFYTPTIVSQLTLGFSYKLSSLSKFSFSSTFVGQTYSWEVRYTRLGFKLRLPINLGHRCDTKTLFFSLGVTGAVLYGTYLYDKYRKRTTTHLKKLERKHRSRLMDGRRGLNATIGEIHTEVGHKVIAEIERKGIVILKAYYGYASYIKDLYLKELKKWGYTRCFKPNKSVNHLLMESMQETGIVFNSERSEIIDVRVLVQHMVANSQLNTTLEDFNKVRGVYNPCLDDTVQPHLMLMIHMNDKILIKILKKGKDKVSLNADYDKYMTETSVEPRYHPKVLLSSLFV